MQSTAPPTINGLLRRFTPLRKRFAFVAGNDAEMRLRDLAARYARVLLRTSRPLQSEGAGNAARSLRPQPRMQNKNEHTSVVTTVTPETPGIPRAMVLTVSFVLSPVTGLFATVAGGMTSASLTPASGRQDHTTSPSASRDPSS